MTSVDAEVLRRRVFEVQLMVEVGSERVSRELPLRTAWATSADTEADVARS